MNKDHLLECYCCGNKTDSGDLFAQINLPPDERICRICNKYISQLMSDFSNYEEFASFLKNYTKRAISKNTEKSNTETYLGKIKTISFGFEEDLYGLHTSIIFGEDPKGVTEFIECDHYDLSLEIMKHVSKLLEQAKVDCVAELKDKPVEVTLENNMLKSWRILTEVL